MTLLPCQRPLFDMPPGIAYLDGAAYSPLPREVAAAGVAGLSTKVQPWARDTSANDRWAARARAAAARIVGAMPDDMAIVASVAHAMAVALDNLPVPPGTRLLRIENEFPSVALALDRLASERGATVEAVPRPADGDWTGAILAALHRPGAPPVAVAALTPLHWTDGTLVQLEAIAPALRAAGAALVVDATQAAGVLPIDVAALQPDFLAFPTYKWLLGPYSLAFLYAAPHRQTGRPLDEHSANQARPGAPPNAGRYDKGERNDPAALPMATLGMELVAGWTPHAVSARLRTLTATLASRLETLGIPVPPERFRAPHILGVRFPGIDAADAVAVLATRQVFVSDRGGNIRISPHVWADEADIDQCVAALEALRPHP